MAIEYRKSDELASVRARVAELAIAKGRVFRREHLRGWGIDEAVTPTMVRRGWWTRLRHGVYADSSVVEAARHDPKDRHLLDCAAAIQALPLPTLAVASTAAIVHGLPVDRRLLRSVELVRGSFTDVRALHRRVRDIHSHAAVHIRTHRISREDVDLIGGIPTVSRMIAAVTCAAQCDEEWAIAVLDAAAWQSPESLRKLFEVADDWPVLRGIGMVRSVLPSVRPGAQSPLESFSRIRLVKRGLPEPELQVPMYDSEGLIGFVDMAWRDLGVVGEADGAAKYSSPDDYLREKIREDRIRSLGFIVVRWTWNQMIRDPAAVAARIRHAAAIAHHRTG